MSLEQFRALGQDRMNYISGNLDPKYQNLRAGGVDGNDPDAPLWAERNAQEQQLGSRWREALDPATRAQWDNDVAFSAAQHKKHMGTGMNLALAAIMAGAGGMGLGQIGGLEGLFGGTGEAGASVGVDAGLDGMHTAYANPMNIPGPMVEPGMAFSTAAPIDAPYMMEAATGSLGGGSAPAVAGADWGSYSGGGDYSGYTTGAGETGQNSLFSKLKSMLPSSPTEVLKMASGLGGLYSNYQSNKAYGNMAANLASLYGPGSAYEEQLRKELLRRDAAAGRRSQYGPRAVELQARLAQLASGQAPTLMGIYGQEQTSRNNMINSGLKLADQMGIWGKLASLFGN